jgi:hypothetical protein
MPQPCGLSGGHFLRQSGFLSLSLFDDGILRKHLLRIRCRQLTRDAPNTLGRLLTPSLCADPCGGPGSPKASSRFVQLPPRDDGTRDDKTSCLALMGSALPSRKPLVGEPGGLQLRAALLFDHATPFALAIEIAQKRRFEGPMFSMRPTADVRL